MSELDAEVDARVRSLIRQGYLQEVKTAPDYGGECVCPNCGCSHEAQA